MTALTPLEEFKHLLPKMPIERIQKVRESLKESVGGGVKTATEVGVAFDFLSSIEEEIARRQGR